MNERESQSAKDRHAGPGIHNQSLDRVLVLLAEARTAQADGDPSLSKSRFAMAVAIVERLDRIPGDGRVSTVLTELVLDLRTMRMDFGHLHPVDVTVDRVHALCRRLIDPNTSLAELRLIARIDLLHGEAMWSLDRIEEAEASLFDALIHHRRLTSISGDPEGWHGATRTLSILEMIDLGIDAKSEMRAARPRPDADSNDEPNAEAVEPPKVTVEPEADWVEIRETPDAAPYRVDRAALDRLIRLGVVRPDFQARSQADDSWQMIVDVVEMKWPSAKRSSDWVDIVRGARPAVPCIHTRSGNGTGFVVTTDGLVVTNRHVVEGARAVVLGFTSGNHEGAVIRMSDQSDLALIKTHARIIELASPLTLAPTPPELASEVVAIGYPAGLLDTPTITKGIVSAIRTMQFAPYPDQDYLQIDAPINQGNSGGPVVGHDGSAVGMATFIHGRATKDDQKGIADEALSFAVPSVVIRRFLDQARDDIERGTLEVPSAEAISRLHR